MCKVNNFEELWKAVNKGFSYVEEQCLWDEYYDSALAGSVIPFYEGGMPLIDEDVSGFLLMNFHGVDDFTVDVYVPNSELTLMGSVRVTPDLSVSDVYAAIDEMKKLFKKCFWGSILGFLLMNYIFGNKTKMSVLNLTMKL